MAKKPRTEKQLANDRRLAEMAKAKAKEKDFKPTEVLEKQAKQAGPAPIEEPVEIQEEKPSSPALPASPQVDPQLVAAIVAATMELQRQNPQAMAAQPEQKLDEIARMSGASVGVNGVQGVVSKYSVEKSYYPDPTQRLLSEPSLVRFALKENYLFRWQVDGVEYVKNNVAFSEPRFTLELFRKLYDDEGNPTGRAALVARNMLHEDQMTTRMAAVRLGLVEKFGDGEDNMREIMDEVRYWRMQQWLLDLFRPAKIETHRKRPTSQVIDGKVVEVFDTETLIDKDSAKSQTATLQNQSGVGNVTVPQD